MRGGLRWRRIGEAASLAGNRTLLRMKMRVAAEATKVAASIAKPSDAVARATTKPASEGPTICARRISA